MLAAGAGALFLAQAFGWFTAYAVMALGLSVGLAVLLIRPEPTVVAKSEHLNFAASVQLAVVEPFKDFSARQGWLWMLIFTVLYKLGEAMAGFMANPLYVELGFSLDEIATVSKVFGFAATVVGGILGGLLTARLGLWRALLLFGILQSLGNLAYVLQVQAGHDVRILALCVALENLTGGMAGAALVAWLSSLCNPAFTATQYALLSSLSSVGRTTFSSSSGYLAQTLGWTDYYLLTTVITVPALLLLWIKGRSNIRP
jgi:PAT family beta-lactamase induction signal transducer AmpG